MRIRNLLFLVLPFITIPKFVANGDPSPAEIMPRPQSEDERVAPLRGFATFDEYTDYEFKKSSTLFGGSSRREKKKELKAWDSARYLIKGHVEVCTAFHSMAWILWSVLDSVKHIDQISADGVFRLPEKQEGPLVVTMRVLQLLHQMLRNLYGQLLFSDEWSTDTQMRVAHCYMDFSLETANMVQALEKAAANFNMTHPVKEFMHAKIVNAAESYAKIAASLYVDVNEWNVRKELLRHSWPRDIPNWFQTRFPLPRPEAISIRAWVMQNDAPISPPHRLLLRAMKQWSMTPPRKSKQPYDTWWQDRENAKNYKAPKDPRPKKNKNKDKEKDKDKKKEEKPPVGVGWEFDWDKLTWWEDGKSQGKAKPGGAEWQDIIQPADPPKAQENGKPGGTEKKSGKPNPAHQPPHNEAAHFGKDD